MELYHTTQVHIKWNENVTKYGTIKSDFGKSENVGIEPYIHNASSIWSNNSYLKGKQKRYILLENDLIVRHYYIIISTTLHLLNQMQWKFRKLRRDKQV